MNADIFQAVTCLHWKITSVNPSQETISVKQLLYFLSLWPVRFHDRRKFQCSSQGISLGVVLGLLQLNCDLSRNLFLAWVCGHYFSAETSDSRKYICLCRLYGFTPARRYLRNFYWLTSIITRLKTCLFWNYALWIVNNRMNNGIFQFFGTFCH